MGTVNDRIPGVAAALSERLKAKHPAEIHFFLGIMGKAEGAPAPIYLPPLTPALDEFLPEEAHG
ncbi:MAG: hypothetical protein ACYDCX_02725 [Acidithiobacillus sp.]